MAEKQKAGREEAKSGHEESYEEELAGYLQQRIKPGLNRGAIPLLARSIAKDLAHREHPNGESATSQADQEDGAESKQERGSKRERGSAQAREEDGAESKDEAEAGSAEAREEDGAEGEEERGSAEAREEDGDSAESDEAPDFEADMHDLQAELGEDWILRFSVHGDDGWLTAEKDDGSQRVEAQTAEVISEVVARLNEGGGREG